MCCLDHDDWHHFYDICDWFHEFLLHGNSRQWCSLMLECSITWQATLSASEIKQSLPTSQSAWLDCCCCSWCDLEVCHVWLQQKTKSKVNNAGEITNQQELKHNSTCDARWTRKRELVNSPIKNWKLSCLLTNITKIYELDEILYWHFSCN